MKLEDSLKRKVEDHFRRLSNQVRVLANGDSNPPFFNERMFANPGVGMALVFRTFDNWWDSPNGIWMIRRIVRQVTEFLMKYDSPALQRIDPEVAWFVWTDEIVSAPFDRPVRQAELVEVGGERNLWGERSGEFFFDS